MANKPFKHSVSLVIKDNDGNFLVVKRADDPDDRLANVWGFPAATLTADEDERAAAMRVGRQKLGIVIALGNRIDESTHDRDTYVLRLTDYEATIASGTPKAPQNDTSVSQYADCKFTNDPSVLFEAARKGSQCTQIFLESIGQTWE